MNDHEKFLFDLDGFIAIPDALDAGQIEALDPILDEKIAALDDPDFSTHRFGGLLRWGKPFRDLIDNPGIAPYLNVIVGEKFRLDHIYLDVIRGGLSPIGATLHGGSTPFNPSQYYHFHNGQMHNGLIVVAYNLRDVNPGDGGFACVPGSHKSNYPFPKEWKNLEDLQPCVRTVPGPAGTAVIFTEALVHGALPWSGAGERRTVFFKYSPHPVSWAANYFDESRFDELTESQRAILEAPNARYGGRYEPKRIGDDY